MGNGLIYVVLISGIIRLGLISLAKKWGTNQAPCQARVWDAHILRTHFDLGSAMMAIKIGHNAEADAMIFNWVVDVVKITILSVVLGSQLG